ncbi:hypothetical protein BZA70DRAFT_67528 [Myxozyma melibiosi]|uniref:Autophagy-related protein 2 n=1 Tax=Myxozyma melibiosi TaxID=54550 RepID=A0ABR1F1A5_9ASCO
MSPPWLPQNIQKRLLRYILSRAAIFNELDLANLDVQLGASSSVILRNLRLNVDAITIPGIFLRDGVVGEIRVQIPRNILSTPIDVRLSEVNVTVAPSASGPSAEEFIARATNELATSFLRSESVEETIELEKSIIHPQPESDTEGAASSEGTDSMSETDDELLGLGTGGFNLQSIMANVVDRLVSQLRVTIETLSLRVVLQDMILQGTVGQAVFGTSGDSRTINLKDVQFDLPPDLKQLHSQSKRESVSSYESAESSTDSDFLSNSDGEDAAFDMSRKLRAGQRSYGSHSMTESMLFSSREARSIYQSALSPSEHGLKGSSKLSSTVYQSTYDPPSSLSRGSKRGIETISETKSESSPRLLWCDELDVRVKSSFSMAEIKLGVLKSGLAHIEDVVAGINHLVEGFLKKPPSDDDDIYVSKPQSPAYVGLYEAGEAEDKTNLASKETTRNVKIRLKRFEASLTSDLNESGGLTDQKNACLVLDEVFASVTQSYSSEDIHNPYLTDAAPSVTSIFTIDKVSVWKGDFNKDSNKVVSFSSESLRNTPDISMAVTSSIVSLEIPKELHITASADFLEELASFAKSMLAVSKTLGRPSNAPSSFDKSGSNVGSKIGSKFYGTTGPIYINMPTSDPAVQIDVRINPISIDRAALKTDLVVARLPGSDISLYNIHLESSPRGKFVDPDPHEGRLDGLDLVYRLLISSLKVNCSSVETLQSSILAIAGDATKVLNAFSVPDQRPPASRPPPTRVRFQQRHPGSVVEIAETVVALEFPGEVGNVAVNLDKLAIASFEAGCINIWTEYLRVVRHAPMGTNDEDEFELLGAALNDRHGDRPMLSAVIRDMNNLNIKLYNTKFEYRVDLVMLFASAFESKKKEADKEPKVLRQSLFGIERPDSPSSDFDEIDSSYGEKSGIDDEDYADEDFGMPRPSELGESIATLKSSDVPFKFEINIRDCAIGLNPLNLPSKGLLVITDGQGDGYAKDMTSGVYANLKVRRATLFLVDDQQSLHYTPPRNVHIGRRRAQVVEHLTPFADLGYVNVASMSSASVNMKISKGQALDSAEAGPTAIEMEVRDDLLFIESCADSTQTLIELFNGLKPAVVIPPDEERYQTEVAPVDIMASLDDDAFRVASKAATGTVHNSVLSDAETVTDKLMAPSSDLGLSVDSLYPPTTEMERQLREAVSSDLEIVESYYGGNTEDGTEDALAGEVEADYSTSRKHSASSLSEDEYNTVSRLMSSTESDVHGDLLSDVLIDEPPQKITKPQDNLQASASVSQQEAVDIINKEVREAVTKIEILEDHFGGGRSLMNTTMLNGETPLVTVKVRDVHVLWNLHDGYDWPHTRDSISKAVKKVENRALKAIRARIQGGGYDNDEDESIIGDFLFNSIYIGVPSGNDPRELTNAINREIDDDSETASQTSWSTEYSSRPASRGGSRSGTPNKSKLRLKRSKSHKLQVELKGVSLDFNAYSESCVVANSLDVRVRDFEIFDNVPTSTWRKFVTSMYPAEEREKGGSMAHLEMLNVRPDPALPLSDIVLKVGVLPLRLYVDQDALDFLTRFFEFKSDNTPVPATDEIPFLQRVEFAEVKVKLDYKPKKVDYAGLRSGHTTEFMNLFVLDEAKIILRGVVLYGILGCPRLIRELNDIWLPDIKSTQLGDVLAGVAPVRSIVKLGGGMKDLVAVPIREYRKDGRVVRSLQKGALRFAKVTTNELVNLGAKIAIGTQSVLENAETMIVGQSSSGNGAGGSSARQFRDESDSEDETQKVVSMYADQPKNISQGFSRAYSSLNRNFGTARDILVALPSEASEQGGAQKAAVAIARAAPVAVLRSMIGASEAVSSTLLGVSNQMDPSRRRNVEDKYKR